MAVSHRSVTRSIAAAAKDASFQALMDAADAWDALTPQERHTFLRRYHGMVSVSSLPSAWLRMRAWQLHNN